MNDVVAPAEVAIAPVPVAVPLAAPAGFVEPAPIGAVELDRITSVKQFMMLVSDLNAEGKQLWFRGARKASYHLEPSLYRHPKVKDPNKLIELEWELLSDFRHRAPPFVRSLPTLDLEILFLMQHFGVPTRLLDWTENPLVALFFALENDDAAVWVLDPVELNKRALNNREGSDKIVGGNFSDLGGYHPSEEGRKVHMKHPIAVYGIHNSQRIVAQRGGFVLFGKRTEPMDLQPEISGAGGVVRKIPIAREVKREAFMELFNMGVSDSVIYPDLDGLGREIKNRRGF
jgi:hypothetical protein